VEQVKAKRARVDFFDLFEEAAQNNVEAATLLNRLCGDFRDAEATVQLLHDLEHKGDEITHRMYESLHGMFMPPLDREDIIAISTGLDNVMDHIHEAADAMSIYNVKAVTPIACSLGRLILDCTQSVARLMPLLRSRSAMKQVRAGVVDVHRLENDGDALLRQGLIELFHQPRDPIEVVAWKGIYQLMELVTDDCEEIADVLAGLAIKHA